MTKVEQFKLVAKILKQYPPFSEDRLVAHLAIQNYQDNYKNNRNLMKLKLESLLEESKAA